MTSAPHFALLSTIAITFGRERRNDPSGIRKVVADAPCARLRVVGSTSERAGPDDRALPTAFRGESSTSPTEGEGQDCRGNHRGGGDGGGGCPPARSFAGAVERIHGKLADALGFGSGYGRLRVKLHDKGRIRNVKRRIVTGTKAGNDGVPETRPVRSGRGGKNRSDPNERARKIHARAVQETTSRVSPISCTR